MSDSTIFISNYIIDGVSMDTSPAQLLGEDIPLTGIPVVDETLDPAPGGDFDEAKIQDYLKLIKGLSPSLQLPYAGQYARCRMAYSLMDSMWYRGPASLEELSLNASFRWNNVRLGEGAALYNAAQQSADLAEMLDLKLVHTDFAEGEPEVSFCVNGVEAERIIGSSLVCEESSWLVYMPFDVDDLHLGGSALSEAAGQFGGTAPDMEGPDYFIDCYEVVRELAVDGILLSAKTVARGGLLAALDSMCGDGCGAQIDISDLLRAYPGTDAVHALFSELPGVIFQIRDFDFDYVDAELLLQDVMYFPIGHPCKGISGVRISWSHRPAVESIVDSLIR